MAGMSGDKQNNGGADEHEDVNHFETFRGDSAEKGDWKTKYDADIKDVTADDVTNEKPGFILAGGFNGSNEFWERSTKSNDCKGD